MLRRIHNLRKSSRRYWALLAFPAHYKVPQSPVSLENPPCKSNSHSSVSQFFTSLSRLSLEDFLLQLHSVHLESTRALILTQFRDEVAAGHWGNCDTYLPSAIKLLKESPTSLETRLVAETLATLVPAEEIRLGLLEAPEGLMWLEDLLRLLPRNPIFQYISYVLSSLSSLKEAIYTKSLSIGEFAKIRRLSLEQQEMLLRIMRIDKENEVEEVLKQALAKALDLLDLALAHRDRIVSVRNGPIAGVNEAVSSYLAAFESIPLRDYAVPIELKCLLEPVDQTVIHSWLNRLFPDFSHTSTAFPISISDYFACSEPLFVQSDREQLASFQRELLRLCFPAVLLHIELSQEPGEEKERFERDWFLHHSLVFADYMRETAYETDRLVGVFTRDQSDNQLRLDVEHIREKASALESIAQLRSSLEAFLQTPTQRLYVLDYFLSIPQAVDLNLAKSALEQAFARSQHTHKLLCLLVRLPASTPPLQGPWSRLWKLIAFESLSEPFSHSLKSMWKWLKRDTRNCILHKDFIGSRDNVEVILTAIYSESAQNHRKQISDLASSVDFRCLLKDRIERETKELLDWKQLTLTCPQNSYLLEKVSKVLISEAVSLLSPIITTVQQLQTFPVFLDSTDFLTINIWKATFLSLIPDTCIPQPSPPIQLQYPFFLCDYHNIIPLPSFEPLEVLASFRTFSVTYLHTYINPAAVSLVPLYCKDLADLDLFGATYSQEGKLLFDFLCEDCKSFEDLVERYFGCRDLILALCKADKMQLIDDFFAEITAKLKPGGLKIAAADLRMRLSACAEELAFISNPSIRLYAVEERSLHMLNCTHKRASKTLLTAQIKTSHPSLLLLQDAKGLFCCGGTESTWFRTTCSPRAYLITFPNTVTSQADLLKGRSYHGLALLNRYIYALGGNSDHMSLSTCEKFSQATGQWQGLRETLAASRAYFNPLIYSEKIYVLGAVVEILDPRTDKISTLGISLPIRGACISLFLSPDTALVLSEGSICEVDLASFCCKETAGPQSPLWSAQPAVLHQGCIFLIDEFLTFKCVSLSGALLDKGKL